MILCSLLGVTAIVAPAAAQKPVPAPDYLARMNESIDALTRKVWPSVVQILVTSYGVREEPGRGDSGVVFGRQRSVGSGFVIDPEGYIMTNAHVVSGAQRVQIVLPADNADGTLATALSARTSLVPARIVGITTELDLALLKVDGLKLPALPLATYSQVRQGETVFAFGSPLGHAQQPDARAGVGRRATGRSRFAAHLRADRRADQSRATPAVRSSTSAAKSSASTRSSCRSRAATKAWDSPFPARRCEPSSAS